ncbi:mechanosensitive ion channel family protein [Desmospora profundinema]|uniref:Small conductance mechanosensitive channel n=1 Tax=Desmospora profundinema TaxID=1571184 RepID=A0ABU1IM23_9BACL|nr:mechanosensitive ion channel family protein [Desmospora profundinema]MDR6225823.1 small conductance mechanosensitive channel [Desmospora profundinema]
MASFVFGWLTAAEWMENMEEMQGLAEEIVEDPVTNLWVPLVEHVLMPAGQIAVITLLTWLALRFSGKLVDRLLNISHFQQNRGTTLARLIKSTSRYVIYFIATITILDTLGIEVTPILAGAGIVGLAVGFGAQNLVKDVITGFFIIFDNQMEVGDYVQINGNIEGTVEEIGLRVTRIREFSQRLHYVSNGEITRITNYNRDRMRPMIAVTVPYEADQSLVHQTLQHLCENLSKRFAPYVIEPFSIFGVTNIGRDGVEYTLMAVATPDEYWMIQREMRKAVVHQFNEKGIEFAYPRQILAGSQNLSSLLSGTSEPNKDRE